MYPWDKFIEFYLLNNQLVKASVNKMDEQRKRTYWSYYYFHNDSLIYKNENKVATQDVTELQKLFVEFQAKAEKVKALKLK